MDEAVKGALQAYTSYGVDADCIEYLSAILADPDDAPATREDLDELVLPFVEDALDDAQAQSLLDALEAVVLPNCTEDAKAAKAEEDDSAPQLLAQALCIADDIKTMQLDAAVYGALVPSA